MPTDARKTDDGYKLGEAVTDKIGLYGVTPVVQPLGATQAVVAATGPANATATPTDTASLITSVNALKAQGNALVVDVAALIVLANKLRADLIALGAIKGAA